MLYPNWNGTDENKFCRTQTRIEAIIKSVRCPDIIAANMPLGRFSRFHVRFQCINRRRIWQVFGVIRRDFYDVQTYSRFIYLKHGAALGNNINLFVDV